MGRVNDKVALVTGGARGIGAAAAALLAKEGAKVITSDIVSQTEGEQIASELGRDVRYMMLDVVEESAWINTMNNIEADYGRLDILFNNAGITGLNEDLGAQDPEHASLDSWHTIHRINLDGVFLGCKHGIRLMKAQGGSIINMSSRSGVVGIPSAAAYASSKAAIRNHTKTVALYCAENSYNIRCNSVHPGAILTPIWDSMLGDDPGVRNAVIESISAGIPLGHMGEPIDVANAVLYLASDESKYMTGAELTLDGGILAGSSASPGKKDD